MYLKLASGRNYRVVPAVNFCFTPEIDALGDFVHVVKIPLKMLWLKHWLAECCEFIHTLVLASGCPLASVIPIHRHNIKWRVLTLKDECKASS